MQNWQRTWFFMATFVASFCFIGIANAESLSGVYCGGSAGAGQPSVATCHQINDGYGARVGVGGGNVGSFWLTFEEPTGSIPDSAILNLYRSSECDGTTPNVNIYAMKVPLLGNEESDYSQRQQGAVNWNGNDGTGAADRVNEIIGSFTCSTGDYTITLDLSDPDVKSAISDAATLGFYYGGSGNFSAWYTGSVLVGGSSMTWDDPPVEECAFCIFLPELAWGNATDTGNGTVTSTWSDRLGFIFGGATSTFPMCVADGWFNIFDTISSMTTSAIDEQTMLLTTNFGYATTTYVVSATSTAATTEIEGFQALVNMMQSWFGMIAWSAFGLFVFHDIGSRRAQSAAGSD